MKKILYIALFGALLVTGWLLVGWRPYGAPGAPHSPVPEHSLQVGRQGAQAP